jgi:hypothetical protein
MKGSRDLGFPAPGTDPSGSDASGTSLSLMIECSHRSLVAGRG